MKLIISILLLVMTLLYIFLPLNGLAKTKEFGEISIQIDDADSLKLDVQMALLYNNVEVDYDSTILIQSSDGSKIMLYPQVASGSQSVLRIIIGKIEDQNPRFYDMFVVLGDTVTDYVEWKSDREKIFVTYNGILKSEKSLSEDINGSIIFDRNNEGEIISGRIQLNLLFPLFEGTNEVNRLRLKGSFELAVGDYRDLTLGKNISDLEKKKKKRSNLYLAIVFSVFLVAIFGLR
jgi:hypothetical protein